MSHNSKYDENNNTGDFYFNNDGTLIIPSEYQTNTEEAMMLYKQYFGNAGDTSYVTLGSILTCTQGCGLSRLSASEVAQVYVGNDTPVLTCSDREVGSNIHTFGTCNCLNTECKPVIKEDWKQSGNNTALIYKASTDEYEYALKASGVTVCSFGGYIKVAEVNDPAQKVSKKEPVILGSPEYMDELEELLDSYNKDYSYIKGVERKILKSSAGMEKVMTDVNNYGDTDKISDDYWLTLCKKVNEFVLVIGVSKEIHYFRNKLNRAPKSLEEMITANKNLSSEKKWRLLPPGQSIFHMYGADGEYNLKFVSYNGIYEGVYNKVGVLLTELNDAVNMGTYNYSDPSDLVNHGIYDVLTYNKWGTVEGVPKPKEDERDNKHRYEANIDAQNYRKKVEEQLGE